MLTRGHALIRRIRALRSDAQLRASEEVVLAEGIHLALEALAAHAKIETAIVSPRISESREGRDLALRLRDAGVLADVASEATLDTLQDARSPQPVVLVVRHPPIALDAVLAGRAGTPLLVVACGVQDPGNLGALVRTAAAAGATGFVSTEGSAGLTHPRTVRATTGAIFRLPAAEAALTNVLEAVRRSRFTIVGAIAGGGAAYDGLDWGGPIALFLGGEGSGLPPEAEAALDVRVSVPMAPGIESLSVNAAAAVLLFEAAKKRRAINRAG
jgi:TrmH family RNA methyltransferase